MILLIMPNYKDEGQEYFDEMNATLLGLVQVGGCACDDFDVYEDDAFLTNKTLTWSR